MSNRGLHDSIYVLILRHCVLHIFATAKRVNHGYEQGLEILSNFRFYGPQNTIKVA